MDNAAVVNSQINHPVMLMAIVYLQMEFVQNKNAKPFHIKRSVNHPSVYGKMINALHSKHKKKHVRHYYLNNVLNMKVVIMITQIQNVINKDCSSLKIDQCNGKLGNGNSCVADPFNNKCQEMINCKSLTTEFMCLSQFPQCKFVNSICQPQVCTDIKDNISCTFIDECQWNNDKCQSKNCQSIAFGYLCNGNTCGFDNNKCFACVEEYSYQLFVGLISLLLIL